MQRTPDEDIPENTIEVIIRDADDGARADKALAKLFPDLSRERLKESFDARQVWRDGELLTRRNKVCAGDRILLVLPEEKSTRVEAVAMKLQVLYEDEALVVVNKAPGIVVHPGNGVHGPTLVHGLLHHTDGQLAKAAGEERPGVVHRLDRDTSGIIVFAKTDSAYYAMVKAFSERNLTKEYLAIVAGAPGAHAGSVKKPIGRHPVNRVKMAIREDGRFAHTDWQVLERFGDMYSLLRCRIHTGRTHQIRVHLSDLGAPILGDTVYGYRPRRGEPVVPAHFLLHAEHLIFPHPDDERPIELRAPVSKAFDQSLCHIREVFGGDSVT